MSWNQNYHPLLDNLFISALAAALPVVVLLGALALFHIKAHIAALMGLATALLVALIVFGMPLPLAIAAAGNGAAYGLFPIGWIVLCAIFVYDVTVFTGKFEIVKHTIAGLSSDRRIQTLLIGFSFGAFIEGAAGFGTPVAISAAMLIGLGFRPLQAAGLSLIGNTAPVAFGALGTPLVSLAGVTGLDLGQLSAMVGRQLPFFSVLVPFWLIWSMAGPKNMVEVLPACLTAGVSFAIVQFAVSNFHGPWLVDIAASLVSILSLIVLLRFWQPKNIWVFSHEREDAAASASTGITQSEAEKAVGAPVTAVNPLERGPARFDINDGPSPRSLGAAEAQIRPSRKEAVIAWSPWVILSVLVFIWGIPEVKNCFNNVGSSANLPTCTSAPKAGLSTVTNIGFEVPALHKAVKKEPPVVAKEEAESAIFSVNWLSATGTGLLLAGIISGFVLKLSPLQLLKIFGGTLYRVRFSLLTIAAMLGLGYTSRFGGLDSTMGLAFASTGFLFAFFSPLLGWLGVALTGSDTSSNVLFGNLQKVTATQLGISPILTAAANSSGGVMGKMIDAQSIVVAGVATGQQGGEGDILRYVFFHSIGLASLVGLLVLLQAYVFPWVIP